MKFKIVFYLFLFVCIILFFLIFNTNKVLNYQDDLIQKQNQTYIKLKDSIKVLNEYRATNAYFSLVKESNKMEGQTADNLLDLEKQLKNTIRVLNTNGGLEKIIPEVSKKGVFLIDQIKVINQQWILIGFKSNEMEGQALLEYIVKSDNFIQFKNITHFLSPS